MKSQPQSSEESTTEGRDAVKYLVVVVILVSALVSSVPVWGQSSGTCRSAAEFRQVQQSIKNSMGPDEVGIVFWCVLREDRGKIIYWSAVTSQPSSSDTAKVKRLQRKLIEDSLFTFKALASVQGGCYKSPTYSIIRP